MKKIIFVAAIIAVFVLTIATVFFVIRIKQLDSNLSRSARISEAMQAEASRLKHERQELMQERNRLQADVVSYLSIKTNLEAETRKTKEELAKANLAIDSKKKKLEKATTRMEELEKKIQKEIRSQRDTIIKEKDALIQQVNFLKEALSHEQALYYYNLGVTQTIAGLYEDAVKSYEKSLEFNPDNPDAYYNLGLLYEKIIRNFGRAMVYYRKYLELYPQAPDRADIELLIEEFLLSEIMS
jgi:tetratricopeptide (TPR) repeat protein